uniref:Uncharacterized protein n=1 Tax=viral metagenome TaxID=1070528 RepID=A0A6C0BLU5_9ZZZZ
MKYALQIYGVFRTFDVCLSQILKYIMFPQIDCDVFILSQKDDGYSLDNETMIKNLVGPHLVAFKYIEEYPEGVLRYEEELCQHYRACVENAKKKIQSELITNGFVTRLWYRRWLVNQMRIDHEKKTGVKYDWVIRTRFDIGYRTVKNHVQLQLLTQPPQPEWVYMYPDTFSCGSPGAINYESELIHHWPYVYHRYLDTGSFQEMNNNFNTLKKWLFMSEMNLIQYFKASKYHIHTLPPDFKIMRRSMVGEVSNSDLQNDHMTSVHYGLGDRWVDVTDQFVELLAEQYDHPHNRSLLAINNALAKTDPAPGLVKKLVITTLEGNEFVYMEHASYWFKYQYIYFISCPLDEIKKVTYGLGTRVHDVTKKFCALSNAHNSTVYVSNHLVANDPSPGDEKILTLLLQDGTRYEFAEYSILVMA